MTITITSTPQPKWVNIAFSDPHKGYTSVDVRHEQLNGIWRNATLIAVAITDGNIWELSVDGNNNTYQVLSVDGVEPTDIDHLSTLIRSLRT